MESNSTHKQQDVLKTPMLLFDCELADARTERWATHRVQWGDRLYEPRVVQCGSFAMGAWNVEGGTGNSKLQLTLANTDSYGMQIEQNCGWKHAKLTAWFCFVDLESGQNVTDPEAVYCGVANPPEEMTESRLKLGFNNRLNLERLSLPSLRVQPRCPWAFPGSEAQQIEAIDGGERGTYSAFYGCGYSAGLPEGRGNRNGTSAYTACGRTKSDCQARGMFSEDNQGRRTARFGGFQFLPPTIQVRGHGEKQVRLAEASAGTARTGDLVPLLYGTSWIQPPIVFSRSDGNYVHFEVLLASGPIERVRTVRVEGKEIPEGVPGTNYAGSGWWTLLSKGEREGEFNSAFADGNGAPLGDPHGSIAILTLALPQKEYTDSTPKIQVLCDGLKLAGVDANGELTAPTFTANPSWVLLDILRRCGWRTSELSLGSFREAAQWCDTLIPGVDASGAELLVTRARVGLAMTNGRSVSDLLRGIQANANCLLYLGHDGKLALRMEAPIAEAQPAKSPHSNAETSLNGGWPAYEFGDGSNNSGGLVLDESYTARLRLWSRPTSQCPTRYQMEFQDSTSDYRQSTMSLVDVDELARSGQEVTAVHPALGVTSGMHAGAILRLALHKAQRGNQYLEFESSIQAVGLRPGDLISMSFTNWGLSRSLFRVLSIEPKQNFETVRITAQRHEDDWFSAPDFGGADQDGIEGWRSSLARPIAGTTRDAHGNESFQVVEKVIGGESVVVQLELGFTAPASSVGGVPRPLVSHGEVLYAEAGLAEGRWFYGFSCVDQSGTESALSLLQTVTIPIGAPPAHVRFQSISNRLTGGLTRIYRGTNPELMRLIAELPSAASEYTDPGAAATFVPPPDPSYFEARFYWRHELVGPTAVDSMQGDQLQASNLQILAGSLDGKLVRVVSGPAAGQEARILHSDAGTLTLKHEWSVLPASGSMICVSEETWRVGGTGRTGIAVLEVPNRPGSTVHLLGVSANAAGEESAYPLAPFMRLRINGDTSSAPDFDVPGTPSFALANAPNSMLRLSNLGVDTLENTKSVHSGTLRTHYIPEFDPAQILLAAPMTEESQDLVISAGEELEVGDWITIGSEILQVTDRLNGQSYIVSRAGLDSMAEAHDANSAGFRLMNESFSVPLVGGFFGSPAASNFSIEWQFGNRRLVAAEMYLTNSLGDGPPGRVSFTSLEEGGIRFPEGNSFVIQYSGLLAVKSSIAPPLQSARDRSVQSIEATLGEAPAGGRVLARIRAGEEELGQLEFQPGSRQAVAEMSADFPALYAGEELTVDLLEVPGGTGSWPGRDLSVTVFL